MQKKKSILIRLNCYKKVSKFYNLIRSTKYYIMILAINNIIHIQLSKSA